MSQSTKNYVLQHARIMTQNHKPSPTPNLEENIYASPYELRSQLTAGLGFLVKTEKKDQNLHKFAIKFRCLSTYILKRKQKNIFRSDNLLNDFSDFEENRNKT